MSGLLEGKIAVVTGGSKGIGYSIAERFVNEGAKVVISSRNAQELEVSAQNLNCDYFALDVSDSNSVKSMQKWLVDKFGTFDILVNCAGAVRFDNIIDATEEDWDFQISVNLTGTFLTCNKFTPIINDGGAILNISSTLGLRAMEGAVAYCAAKGGVVNLTKAMALDLVDKITDLRQECLTDKKILIQGPNTLAAFLDTIRVGHHYLKLNETAGKVAKVVRGIQKEFSNFDVSTESAMKKLDGALKDVQKLQTRINVLGRTLEKGAENLEEEN